MEIVLNEAKTQRNCSQTSERKSAIIVWPHYEKRETGLHGYNWKNMSEG